MLSPITPLFLLTITHHLLPATASPATPIVLSRSLRDKYQVKDLDCSQTDSRVGRWEAQRGIFNVRNNKGKPKSEAGCVMETCVDGGAIYWCHDVPSGKELDTYNDIADAAQLIVDRCGVRNDDGRVMVQGKVLFNDDWSVTVRYDGSSGDDCKP
ncbi:hypothetical protein B0T20DRAFT_465461 [Sordaria brevicollis]|uniref:Uncharacterized protein n=1 Tax=Sordaria brevicollis TaxID=83679 RepID=A0AAE0PMJ0_SORBR|nr:hypothetical protein B0T20DRAFT_465461 [Sordaria brevicollis]